MPSQDSKRTFRGVLVPVMLFAIVFAVAASSLSLMLRQAEDRPYMLVLTPKLDAYLAAPEAYNTVFIGTSRTFYHIVPDEVEASAAEAGCEGLSVLNLGIFGLNGTEQDWILDKVLDAGKGHLKTVVLEDPLPEARSPKDATNTRARFFSDPALLPSRLDSIASYPESAPKKVFRMGILGYGVTYDLSGVGRGAQAVFPPAETEAEGEYDMSQDGFEALDSSPTEDILARRKAFLEDPQGFEDALARYGMKTNEAVEARAEYLSRRLRRIQSEGLNAALYISPDPMELDRTPRTGEAVRTLMPETPVLNFNRPDVYPELFERDLWYDFSHVGGEGAHKLSRLVGKTLCESSKFGSGGDTHAVR